MKTRLLLLGWLLCGTTGWALESITTRLVFGCDSFSFAGTYPQYVQSAGFSTNRSLIYAYNGHSMGSWISNWWPQLQINLPTIKQSTNRVAVFLSAGTNPNTNMGSGYSSPTEYSSTNWILACSNYLVQAAANDVVAIGCTIPPIRGEEFQGGYSQPEGYVLWKARINAWLRTTPLLKHCVDLAGQFPDASLEAGDYPDGQHPAAHVYGWIGTNIAQFLTAYGAANQLDSNQTLPKAAEWSAIVNFTPGDGDVVELNPPLFKWVYRPDPVASVTSFIYPVYRYRFQCASEPTFASPLVNIVTSNNMYNLLAPFSGVNPVYWRVEYLNTNLAHVAWSDVRSFSISGTAVEWDRSMLANNSYLASKTASHPFLLFNAANKAAVYQFVQTNDVTTWNYLVSRADVAIASPWWAGLEGKPYAWWDQVSLVAMMWQLTGASKYLSANPMALLNEFAVLYLNNDWDQRDVVSGGTDESMARALALGYDLLYNQLDATQRSNVREALARYCKWVLDAQFWYGHTTLVEGSTLASQSGNQVTLTAGSVQFDPLHDVGNDVVWFSGERGRITAIADSMHATVDTSQTVAEAAFLYYRRNKYYPPPYQVFSTCAPIISGGHQKNNYLAAIPGALVILMEDSRAKEFFDYAVNYSLAQVYPYGSQDGVNQGRGYIGDMALEIVAALQMGMTFPEAQFALNPFWSKFMRWYQHFNPVGLDERHEPWGDAWYGQPQVWTRQELLDMSGFVSDGAARQHWQNSLAALGREVPLRQYWQLSIGHYFPLPAAVTASETSFFGPLEGWAISATVPPNTAGAFTNGSGFIFQARPRGSEVQHSTFSDGSFQLWHRGAMLTDAGSGNYSKHPMQHYSLLVDGVGHYTPYLGPYVPWYSKLIAWSNATDFTWVGADLTQGFVRTNRGWYDHPGYHGDINQALYYSAPSWHVTSVKRHMLWARKKYWVLYDTLSSSSNATFNWLYHVDYCHRQAGLTNAIATAWDTASSMVLANESVDRMVTNVFVQGNAQWNLASTVTPAFTTMEDNALNNGDNVISGLNYKLKVNRTNGFTPGVLILLNNKLFWASDVVQGALVVSPLHGPFSISTDAGQAVIVWGGMHMPLTATEGTVFETLGGTPIANGSTLNNSTTYALRVASTNWFSTTSIIMVDDDVFAVTGMESGKLLVVPQYGPFTVSTAVGQVVTLLGGYNLTLAKTSGAVFETDAGGQLTDNSVLLNAGLYNLVVNRTNGFTPGHMLYVADDLFQVEALATGRLKVRPIYGPFPVSTAINQDVRLWGMAYWTFDVYYRSNSLSANWPSFTYTAENKYGPRMSVLVKHINNPGTLLVHDQSNSVVRVNPFTGEDLTANEDNHFRANAVWINSPSASGWTFVSVIYPYEAGTTPPIVSRLDDLTVAVTNGSDWDIITASDYAGANYVLDLESESTPVNRAVTPAFSPVSGSEFAFPASVTMTSAGNTIVWTTNGFATTASGASPLTITVAFAGVVSAYAQSPTPGVLDSYVASASYPGESTPLSAEAPVFSPVSGTVLTFPATVNLTSSGNTIVWSTNGFATSSSGSSPVAISLTVPNTTISAYADSPVPGVLDSGVVSAIYPGGPFAPPPTSAGNRVFLRGKTLLR